MEMRGVIDVTENIERVKKSLSMEQIESVLLHGAQVMAEAIRNRAPIAKRGHYKKGSKDLIPPGSLRRSIIAKTMQRRGEKAAPALVAIDYRIAPHAHFVEFGTSRAGPHPFFRPTYDATKDAVTEFISEEFARLIEEATD